MGLGAFVAPIAVRPGADDPITTLLQTLTGTKPAPPPAPSPAPAPKPVPPKPSKPKGKPKPGDLVRASDTPLASTEDIPVNSGMLFEADEYIVTQPQAGKFVGFDSLCTHEGCPVDVFDRPGIMACSCHSTDFKITDGSVIRGPAKKPMPKKLIIVEDGQIYRAKKFE
ncbi:MAG: Rieske (2Fe-2S) protein [Sporichthya sp.]|nr:Rieske (2Fe-2S) protein [Sporichthya sp.]